VAFGRQFEASPKASERQVAAMVSGARAAWRCRVATCWKPTSSPEYCVIPFLLPLTKVGLKAGSPGSAKIQAKGGGTNLHLPALPLTTPVRVQLLQSSSSACWVATYSTAKTNTATEFKAKSD